MRIRQRIVGGLIALMAGLLLWPGAVQGQGTRVLLHPKSQFWIRGDATVRHFTCAVERVEGQARLPTAPDSAAATPVKARPNVTVQVPVRAFDCGNSRMTEDLQETLKMQEHPEIRFELIHATVGSPTDTSRQWRTVNALGALTISGTKRLIRLEASGRVVGTDQFRIRGCKPLKMTHFNVEPPSKVFGIIRVKDRVEAQFDLFAYTAEEGSPARLESLPSPTPPSC